MFKLRIHVFKMMSLFGNTCERMFSRIKIVKSKTRTQLLDVRLLRKLAMNCI